MVREGYMQFLVDSVAVLPPTRFQEEGLAVHARGVERLMREVLEGIGDGCEGKEEKIQK